MGHSHVNTVDFGDGDVLTITGQLFGFKQNSVVQVTVTVTQGESTAVACGYILPDEDGRFTMPARRATTKPFDPTLSIQATGQATEIWTSTLRPASRQPQPAVKSWRRIRNPWPNKYIHGKPPTFTP